MSILAKFVNAGFNMRIFIFLPNTCNFYIKSYFIGKLLKNSEELLSVFIKSKISVLPFYDIYTRIFVF